MKLISKPRVLSVVLVALFLSSAFSIALGSISIENTALNISDEAALAATPQGLGRHIPSMPSILVYTEYADLNTGANGEYKNTMEAIMDVYGPKFYYENLTDYAQLGARIGDFDILLIPEQEAGYVANMTMIGGAWASTLTSFVNGGGIVILMDYWIEDELGGTSHIYNSSGLMTITGFYDRYWDPMDLHNSSDALARGVAGSFTAPNGAVGYVTADGTDVAGDGLCTIAVHKVMGEGHVVLLGFDLYEREVNCEAMLANSIRLHRHVVFDNSHSQDMDILSGFFEFSNDIASQGFGVSEMTTFDQDYLMAAEILVIPSSTTDYAPDEVTFIDDFVASGGGLFLMTDWGVWGETDNVLARFGFERNDTAILHDTDDNVDNVWDIAFSGGNILNHSATLDVGVVETNAGTGFTLVPAASVPLIVADSDGTALWDGVDSADGVTIAAALIWGSGRIIALADTNMADDYDYDLDGTVDYWDSDNEIFLRNSIRWLSAAGIPEQIVLFDESHSPRYSVGSGYYSFGTFLTENGFTLKWMSTFHEALLGMADALVIVEGYYTSVNYTAAEVDTLESHVAGGGGLFLFMDWGQFGIQTDNITQSFGLARNETSYLADTDNTIFGNSYNYYDGEDILSHPITTDVNRFELDRSTGFSSIGTASPLVVSDDDGTCTWIGDGSPADGVVVAAAKVHGKGRVVIVPDVELGADSLDVDGDGLGQMYAADNEVFLRNAFLWLTANRAPAVTVTFPNGGEVLNGTEIVTWTAVDFDSDPLTFDVYYSDNNGADWTPLAMSIAALQYSWNTTEHADGSNYRILVTASDGLLEGEDTSDSSFELDNFADTTTTDFPLDPTTLIIIIAAAGVLIIIIVIVMMKKKE